MSQGGATLQAFLHRGGDGAHGVGSRKRDQLSHRDTCGSGPGWLLGEESPQCFCPCVTSIVPRTLTDQDGQFMG